MASARRRAGVAAPGVDNSEARTWYGPTTADDPYSWVAFGNLECMPGDHAFISGYADRLRALSAFIGLTADDARRAGQQIGGLVYHFRSHGDDPGDKRLAEQLHNASVIAGLGIDGMGWDDPQRAGQAFALAKAELTSKRPQVFPFWNTDPQPEADPTC